MSTFSDFLSDLTNRVANTYTEIQSGATDLPGKLPSDTELTPNLDKYDFKSRTFPIDLGGSGYNNHYMVININVSNYSNFAQVKGPTNNNILDFTRIQNGLSKVDALRQNIDRKYSGDSGDLGQVVFLPRQTRRIVESIALFMPNTINYTNSNQYEDISLTALAESGIVTGMGLLGGAIGAGREFAGVTGALASAGSRVAQLAQHPINPRVEVIFSNSNLREFTFDFLFAPSNEDESVALDTIIKTIRYHAAPELNNFGGKGDLAGAATSLLWIPPSEFDITFFHKGTENTKIPRINTCACTKIDIDYAPTGIYSTFTNGYPVQTRMQITFHEVEVNHRLRVLQGF